jgi:hypothetical protein
MQAEDRVDAPRRSQAASRRPSQADGVGSSLLVLFSNLSRGMPTGPFCRPGIALLSVPKYFSRIVLTPPGASPPLSRADFLVPDLVGLLQA